LNSFCFDENILEEVFINIFPKYPNLELESYKLKLQLEKKLLFVFKGHESKLQDTVKEALSNIENRLIDLKNQLSYAKGWRINKCLELIRYFCTRQGGKSRVTP
jgi:hypothetical protein